MGGTVSHSTRDLAALLVQYGTARKTIAREALFAHGAELATIASLMLANVSQAVDIATAEMRGTTDLEAIATQYPMRDSRGYVTAFYVYARGINSREVSGPHATMSDAETAREADRTTCMDALDIVCGHVFTARGTIVKAG